MAKKLIARCDQIPAGSGLVVYDDEGREIALFNVDGEFYALDNRCPHMEGPLGEGELEGCQVTCPWHGWQFDVRSGACDNMPGEQAKKLRIDVENGSVYLIT